MWLNQFGRTKGKGREGEIKDEEGFVWVGSGVF